MTLNDANRRYPRVTERLHEFTPKTVETRQQTFKHVLTDLEFLTPILAGQNSTHILRRVRGSRFLEDRNLLE